MALQYGHAVFHDPSLSVSNTVFNLLKYKLYSFVLKEVKVAEWWIKRVVNHSKVEQCNLKKKRVSEE